MRTLCMVFKHDLQISMQVNYGRSKPRGGLRPIISTRRCEAWFLLVAPVLAVGVASVYVASCTPPPASVSGIFDPVQRLITHTMMHDTIPFAWSDQHIFLGNVQQMPTLRPAAVAVPCPVLFPMKDPSPDHLHIAALWLTLKSIRLDWTCVKHVVRERNVQGAWRGWAVRKCTFICQWNKTC